MTVGFMPVTQQFTTEFRNMSKFFIKFGKINSPFIRGKWTKRISKLNESGTTYIEQLIQIV